jgi:hypothetical protein
MFGKVGHIGKCSLTFAYFVPVPGRNLMTSVAGQFFLCYMGAMRELGVVDTRPCGAAWALLNAATLSTPKNFWRAIGDEGHTNQVRH